VTDIVACPVVTLSFDGVPTACQFWIPVLSTWLKDIAQQSYVPLAASVPEAAVVEVAL
jgi:hypothetical protein